MEVKLAGPVQEQAPRHVSGETAACILGLQLTVNIRFETCETQPPVPTGVALEPVCTMVRSNYRKSNPGSPFSTHLDFLTESSVDGRHTSLQDQ